MAVLTPGASIFVKAFRVSNLTEEGSVAPGATTVATKDGMKLSITPTLETGADIVAKNANDEITAMARAGDKIKYFAIALELAKPDPQLEQMCCGGVLLSAAQSALGEPGYRGETAVVPFQAEKSWEVTLDVREIRRL